MSFPLARHQVIAPITAIENVAPGHFQVSLHAPQIASSARAGQFVHVLPRETSLSSPLLRRAFSIMATKNEEIEILFRVEGSGTAQIANKRIGEGLDLLGPLGQPFDLELFHVKHSGEAVEHWPILVGGGVGVPPMVFLAKTLKARGLSPLMLIGARSERELLGIETFRDLDVETRVATDDGSAGLHGRVTEILQAELGALAARPQVRASQVRAPQVRPLQVRAVIYACGPLPMLRAVASLAARFKAPCQVSLEENMPCGIGVCNGCVVAMKGDLLSHSDPNGAAESAADYGRYRRICIAGPALWANEVDWEVL